MHFFFSKVYIIVFFINSQIKPFYMLGDFLGTGDYRSRKKSTRKTKSVLLDCIFYGKRADNKQITKYMDPMSDANKCCEREKINK